MLARFDRLAALPFVALLATGCAVAPAGAEDDGTTSSAMLVINPPRTITLDPVTACSSTVADHSTGYPASPGYLTTGTSNAASSCDYYVTEMTGVEGKDITLAVAAQPQLFTDQSSCEASFETFETIGYQPLHLVMNGEGLYYPVPGAWSAIASKTIWGTWLGAVATGGNCAFNLFVEPYSAAPAASGEITYSIYSTIRVATQAVFYANGASFRSPMGTYVVPAP